MSLELDHVGLATPDLERSIAFYRDVLGFQFSSRRRLGDGREQAVFRIGKSLLVLFDGPAGHYIEKARTPRSGMHHLAFALESREYDSLLERCKTAGVRIMFQSVNQGARGMGLATYFYDPDGNDIEIKKYEGFSTAFKEVKAKDYYL